MQREEADGVVLACDFCRRDWDGQEPMVEGHHGSIICLQCLKVALKEMKIGKEKYKCTLCLRENIPVAFPKWSKEGVAGVNEEEKAVVCQPCILQTAKAFSKDPLNDWTWERDEGAS